MVRNTLKFLQHLLQDIQTMSDHSGTLCIKWFKFNRYISHKTLFLTVSLIFHKYSREKQLMLETEKLKEKNFVNETE